MADKFYELKYTPTHVRLRVSPSGKDADPGEIVNELQAKGIAFKMEHLNAIMRRGSNQFETLTTRELTDYEVYVDISQDESEATLTIFPPSNPAGKRLDPMKVKEALKEAGVTKGLLLEEIQRVVKNRIESEAVVIARGQQPENGMDGYIQFPQNKKEDEPDYSSQEVSLKEMNLIHAVSEGDVVATIVPPTEGLEGYTVLGKPLRAKSGKKAPFRLGKNASLNEDGTQILSAIPGYMVVEGEKIGVENVYQVASVGSSTGNIRFEGVVYVQGTVEDGFTVEADQGIDIMGTVGKAKLISKGNIIIRGGVMGGHLETQNTVEAKFISDSTVRAGMDVVSQEYILNSDVQAGRFVRVVKGPDGFINGGLTRAGELVWTPALGSSAAELITEVQVGMGPSMRQKFDKLQSDLDANLLNFDRYSKNLFLLQRQFETKSGRSEGVEQIAATLEKALPLREEIWKSLQDYNHMIEAVSQMTDESGFVFVANVAHPGAQVSIRRQRLKVTTELGSCCFRILRGTMKPHPFDEAKAVLKLHHGGKLPF
ncbi:MAG: FapA family protein [Deltaproteobacteria bacterium]|nr:FapA family protein [Deltaproteobacteria bacterium]